MQLPFSLKQLILSHSSLTPLICHALHSQPLTLTDGYWSFPAALLNDSLNLAVDKEKLEVSKYNLVVEADTLIMKIEECKVIPKVDNETFNEIIYYKDDPDIKHIMERLSKSRKQSKYKLSLPKSLQNEKNTNNITQEKAPTLQPTTKNTSKLTLKKFKFTKSKDKPQIVKHRTNNSNKIKKLANRELEDQMEKVKEPLEDIRINEKEYYKFLEWRQRLSE
jgi:hypothetical protein